MKLTISLTPAVLAAIAGLLIAMPTWLLIVITSYVAVVGLFFLPLLLDRYASETARRLADVEQHEIRNERHRRRLPPAPSS